MKLSILFLINPRKRNSRGFCTLMCRLTYDKKRKTFSTGKLVYPPNWNSKQQLVKPPEPDAVIINTQLSLIKTKLSQAFLMLQVQENDFTVDDIYKTYKGELPQKFYKF